MVETENSPGLHLNPSLPFLLLGLSRFLSLVCHFISAEKRIISCPLTIQHFFLDMSVQKSDIYALFIYSSSVNYVDT